ncbi:undecaprenyl-diphosphate phosphatase [Amycolatopsis alkalitolerans]|uniref:Undecaprenyl-diphosphatase n=1 Tax=Amycolatopsis alkalitolerans TaxID=2547244 RepID=A0A5C4M4K4_9PSEU|nr:undecaprenyl-diphosphate phosphatase [Amycolatopsis alkalitolerans]TNC28028.1 undecaprenyl-diphosphate phosphatase [Amycolatopsis alkalitolerans]
MSVLTYPEMIVVGLLQGVSELFPVSSLGHSVLVPGLIGGSWARDLDMSAKGSPYLDSLVAMHVATAAALVIFFWRDWVRIIGALFGSIRHRRISTPDERLAWLLVVATIPVGIAGLALDKVMREYLGKPVPAAVFLLLNGIVLFTVERLQRTRRATAAARTPGPGAASRRDIGEQPTMVMPAVAARGPARDVANQPTTRMRAVSADEASDARLARLGWWEAIAIGACQILALLPGISRSGATMAGGLLRGLRHDDAARFAFLLATPVIAAAGMLKVPELARPEMHGAIGPTLVGSLVAGVGAYFSVRFLVRYFQTRTLTPFAIYCVIAGLGCLAYFTLT